MEEQGAYYAVDVEEAARVLQLPPERVREQLLRGELEGIPPGGTAEGDWKVLLPATPDLQEPAPAQAPPEEPAPAQAPPESPAEEQEEAGRVEEPSESAQEQSAPEEPERPADFIAPPAASAASDAAVQVADEAPGEPPAEAVEDVRTDAGDSGWTTTKQAAKVLGVSRRSVQGYVRRGHLEAREEGEGVNKTFLIAIDSLNALRDRRNREAGRAAKLAKDSAEEERTANLSANTGEALRHAIERVEARTAEATELRIRLEITEKAQSTLRAELEEERRRRGAAERERDELRRRLEARPEPRESPVSPAPAESPTGADAGPQEAREATQSAAETLRGPEPRPTTTTGGAQVSPRTPPQPAQRRGWLWRRVFGR
jgi:outer membrane biosynthesis protein TonB